MSTPFSLLLALFLKSVVVLSLAGVLALALRRRSATWRHAVWNAGLVGVLMLPIAAVVLPGFALPQAAVDRVPGQGAAAPRADSAGEGAVAPAYEGEAESSTRSEETTEAAAPRAPRTGAAHGLVRWLFRVWAVGLVLLIARLGVGLVGMGRIMRNSREVDDVAYHLLVEGLCESFAQVRRPRLLMTDQVMTPMTWGIFRPVVVLPEGADAWPEFRRRVVLAHELAHVGRRDVLFRMLSQVACALYWMNPLVWVAAHRLRIESEYACDDLVLSRGTRRVPYAEALLEVARSAKRQVSLPGIHMARSSELESRLRAVLNPERARAVLSLTARRIVWGAALCIVLPLAAFSPLKTAPLAVRPDAEGPSAAVNSGPRAVCEQDRWSLLGDEDPAATHRLLLLLQSKDKDDREEAVRALGNVGTREAVPALIAALDDPSEHVRQGAAAALGNLGDRRAVEPLITALGDPNEHVRQVAAGGLGDLGDARALAPLLGALRSENKHVRQTAALALGRLGDRRAADRLAATLSDPEPHVRAAALRSLGQLGARASSEQMVRLFETSENLHVRLAAARSLGQLGDLRGVGFLVATLRGEPEPFTRGDAAWALGAIGHVLEAEAALLAALHDESRFVQYAAVCSLGRAGTDTAEEPLRRILRDRAASERVQDGIAWALNQIRPR